MVKTIVDGLRLLTLWFIFNLLICFFLLLASKIGSLRLSFKRNQAHIYGTSTFLPLANLLLLELWDNKSVHIDFFFFFFEGTVHIDIMYQITDAAMCENRELNLLLSIIYYELLVKKCVEFCPFILFVFKFYHFYLFHLIIFVIIMKKLIKHGSDYNPKMIN